MEKTAGKDQEISLHTNLEILFYLGAGALVALLPLRFQYIALFPLLTYAYMHNRKALLFFLFSLSIFLFALSVSTAYLTLLGILIFFLLVQCASAAHASMPLWLTVIGLAVQVPFIIQLQDVERIVCVGLLLGMLYVHQFRSNAWLRSDWKGNDLWTGSLLSALCLSVAYYFPHSTQTVAVAVGMALLLVCRPLPGTLFVLLLNSYIYHFPLSLCLSLLVLRLVADKGIALVLWLLLVWLLRPTPVQLAAVACALLLWFLFWRKERMKTLSLPHAAMEENGALRRRLQNYAGVFYSLAQFYEHLHQQESGLLYQMADGVEQMAQQLNARQGTLDASALTEILEGYQFTVRSLRVERLPSQIQIEGVIDQITRREMEETLIPLLNTLYRSDFHLEHLKDSRLFYRSTGFVLDSAAKLQVQAAYDSISVQKQENGDTCSIFHHDVHTLCTLSDGMGSGAEAAKSSALITGVLQRMIASDMEIVAAVKTVNRLIHSDVYATLDVICVNAHTQKAYLVKSAACPTLLIRQGHLLQLDGRSLPVGMLEEIEPDCMELQLQTGDEILMVSDGVRMQEIRTWLHARKEGEVQEELSALMRLLRQRPREDDTTALLLRLQKAERSMTKGETSHIQAGNR